MGLCWGWGQRGRDGVRAALGNRDGVGAQDLSDCVCGSVQLRSSQIVSVALLVIWDSCSILPQRAGVAAGQEREPCSGNAGKDAGTGLGSHFKAHPFSFL